MKIDAVGFHNREMPGRELGKHLWVVMSVFRVSPGLKRFDLDRENLLTIEGPGCYWCEQPWTEELSRQPCGGE